MACLQDFRDFQPATPRDRRHVGLLEGAEATGPVIRSILAAFRSRTPPLDALEQCLDLVAGGGSADVAEALARLSPPWRDHAIASVYAVLMPGDRRKRLGAYFTPPHLVTHLVDRLTRFGLDLRFHRLRDPAAGGAAFLVPLARRKVEAWRQDGEADETIVAALSAQLRGCEIDAGLAALANALLKRMLVEEFDLAERLVAPLEIVSTGDSLAASVREVRDIDHEIGNPPYLRLPRALESARQAEFSDISDGRLNLYAMFMRRALDHVPPGGLIGYVIPTSFLGGPEFRSFRRKAIELAEVLVVDLIEKRSDVFLDATQDACFVVLRRRDKPLGSAMESRASSGLLRGDGAFRMLGTATCGRDGGAWRLPGDDLLDGTTLAGWGYRGTIGYLVANRQSERLHGEAAPGRYPLVWAKAISSDGVFDFDRALKHKQNGWIDAPEKAGYIVRDSCVAVQRTSSRGQRRRLTAAAIPKSFIDEHGGIVAENHVILLIPRSPEAGAAEDLARALNTASASEQLDRVCGSASISVRLLETLRLPSPQPRVEQKPRAMKARKAHRPKVGRGHKTQRRSLIDHRR